VKKKETKNRKKRKKTFQQNNGGRFQVIRRTHLSINVDMYMTHTPPAHTLYAIAVAMGIRLSFSRELAQQLV
jgi:hypothetical protein